MLIHVFHFLKNYNYNLKLIETISDYQSIVCFAYDPYFQGQNIPFVLVYTLTLKHAVFHKHRRYHVLYKKSIDYLFSKLKRDYT